MTFCIEPLSRGHERSGFDSGSEPLDRYFREQASQDVKRRISTCFVALEMASATVVGFYTLAAAAVPLSALRPEIAKRLPRYPVVPAALLGRLAIGRNYQGKGLGGVLLADAVLRASRAELGIFALLVDAKNEPAERFYEHHGFMLLPGETRRLCLPMAAAMSRFGAVR